MLSKAKSFPILANRVFNILNARKFSSDLHEPDYLKEMEPKIPIYNTLNIQIRGYDYPILENYQKFIHRIAKNMDVEVEDAWAIPPQVLQVSTFKPQSDIVNNQYNLNIYERTVQINDCSSLELPMLIRAIEASQPMGVTVNIIPHEPYHEEARYIPDNELKQLKQELDDMGGPLKKK
ncbi:hypothetical protein HHI36_009619 [Cryptolaemus montrouzieri]|uniref:Small ribosomal subunit protein uS10 domain-containing protein n=1 Tax=Cryptolaemus montrouzieri TaxID=559131 RepID=A0ABD2MGC1_9CUCU